MHKYPWTVPVALTIAPNRASVKGTCCVLAMSQPSRRKVGCG